MNPQQADQQQMGRRGYLVLLVFLASFVSLSQTLKEQLGYSGWYSKQVMGDSLVSLYKDPKQAGAFEWRLSATGKCLLRTSSKTKTDSSFLYGVDKKNISFHYKLKDSVKLFRYEVYKSETQVLHLRLNYSFKYFYRKGNDTIVMPELTVTRGKQIKTILKGEDITVFAQMKARRNDSIDLAIWGQFAGFVKDTILVDSDQFVEHNFYKKYKDSLHYYSPLLFDTIIRKKIPLKYITGIYKEREPFGMYMTRTTITGMGLGLGFMMASLLSGTDSDAGNRYATIATASFLTVPVSFGLGLAYSKEKYRLVGDKNAAKLWKVERHMPRPEIKIYKKGKRII